ncbi:MAG TPA: PIN domain-containing protein [Bryobacteraceae bacterium]|nr:PIN domain-containing protein [Bryobacteraceae bacterium]
MKPVVIDTDVASFLFKNDSRAQSYLPRLRDRQWLISFMTEAELEQWALLSNWHAKRIEWLRVFLGRFVVVPSSRDLVVKWAEVMVAARRTGRRLETADAWIAATAMLYDAPLITHNAGDYLGVPGLMLITEV